MLFYPRPEQDAMKVAILVSGGIAPGVNAVIDGITRRHHMYADGEGYKVNVHGIKNGFHGLDALLDSSSYIELTPDKTSEHTSEGGAILGTSRFESLLNRSARKHKMRKFVECLFERNYDILYIIGGDGSMKAAHALWNDAQVYRAERNEECRLSVVAVPKTMDNDILWVWQTFGFLSAVEKAREVIEHLDVEAKSNPRLGIIQLFGSDAGFIVSHAVLASKTNVCDVALIPEVEFSMQNLAQYLKVKISERAFRTQQKLAASLIVLGETAIPLDAENYLNKPEVGLTEKEKKAVEDFLKQRNNKQRIEGQTDDALRTAGLKIVSKGLLALLPTKDIKAKYQGGVDWGNLRVFTNEPRHLLRAIPPSCLDIINGQRLGTMAVDNALAGYTDFMISQWLTEFVLVPLKLAVLGRKRIPQYGIFWKSVIAKTGQPFNLN